MVKRLIFLLAALIFITSMSVGSKCEGAPANSGSQVDQDIPVLNYKWATLHWHGRTLYQVGSQKLPVPISLPAWMRPLGNKALIASAPTSSYDEQLHRKPQLVMYLWLPTEKAPQLWQWLDGFPKNFIIPTRLVTTIHHPADEGGNSTGKILFWPRVKHMKYAWVYRLYFDTSLGESADLLSLTFLVPSNSQEAEMYLLPGMAPVLLNSNSPIIHRKAVLQVRFQFYAI